MNCPCCGQSVAGLDRAVVDLNTNTVSRSGRVVTIPAKCAEIASVLAAQWPNTVEFERLRSFIWGSALEGGHPSTLKVYATLLRKALKPLGMDVLCVRGVGYRFVFNVEGSDECRTTE